MKRSLLSPPPFAGFQVEGLAGAEGYVSIPVDGGGMDRKTDTPSEIAIGFVPHDGENRTTRRAAVARWEPPKAGKDEPKPPTRRELWEQRKRQRRGKMKR